MSTNSEFKKRLELGNNKEHYVNDILNLCSVPSVINNKENVYDMDLYLPEHEIFADVKYLETSFDGTRIHEELTAENCLILTLRHLKNYEQKRQETGKDTWIIFLIDFKDQGIYELRFIKTKDIFLLEQQERAFRRNILDDKKRQQRIINLIRTDCLNMDGFLWFLKTRGLPS